MSGILAARQELPRLIRKQPIRGEPLAFGSQGFRPLSKRSQPWPMNDSRVSEPTAVRIRFNMAAACDLHSSQRRQFNDFVVNASHMAIRLNEKLHGSGSD